VAHHGLSLKLASSHYLFRTKPLADQCFDRLKRQRPIKPVPPGSVLAAAGFLHRMTGAIAAVVDRLISLHLPIQRATMTPKMFSHLANSKLLPPHERSYEGSSVKR
jgi:hypothetical protein